MLRMRLTMVSLVSELTSYRWKNAWLRGNIRSLDPSLVFIAGMIFIRALLICCLSVTSVRIFSLCKSVVVVVVVILPMFVSNSTLFSTYSIRSRSGCVNLRAGWATFWRLRLQKTALSLLLLPIKIGNW